jgi:hypothetical protein
MLHVLQQVKGLVCTLEAGQVLYIPPFWHVQTEILKMSRPEPTRLSKETEQCSVPAQALVVELIAERALCIQTPTPAAIKIQVFNPMFS